MKHRITVTIDPAVRRRAKILAYAKNTSVSGLIEHFLRSAPMPGRKTRRSFVDRWAGRFSVTKTRPGDLRMEALKTKHQL